jgi:hypothetical protein
MLDGQDALTATKREAEFNLSDGTCLHRMVSEVIQDPGNSSRWVQVDTIYIDIATNNGDVEFFVSLSNDSRTIQLPSNVSFVTKFVSIPDMLPLNTFTYRFLQGM